MAFEKPFQGHRIISDIEKQYISALSDSQWLKEGQLKQMTAEFFEYPADVKLTFQIDVTAKIPDVKIPFPRTSVSFPEADTGVSFVQSGQSIVLPTLVSEPQVITLEEVGTDFQTQLLYWMSRDFSSLLLSLKTAQQETAWSDLELQQLTRRYAASQLTGSDSSAFLFALWYQAGYQVSLALAEQQWLAFVKLPGRIQGVVTINDGHDYWLSLGRELDVAEQVQWFDPPKPLAGQPIRISALGDRTASSDLFNKLFDFESPNGWLNVQFELPVHWHSVERLPGTPESRFRQPLPNSVFEGLAQVMPTLSLQDKTKVFARWLSNGFKNTQYPVSVYQMLSTGEASTESRFILLAQWWQWLTGQPAALIVSASDVYLALRLDEPANKDGVVEYRNHQWWLWSAALEPALTVEQTDDLKWRFLP